MLKDFKKANKKEVITVNSVILNNIIDGCCWDDLYREFEKENNLKIVEVKNDWLCCIKGSIKDNVKDNVKGSIKRRYKFGQIS